MQGNESFSHRSELYADMVENRWAESSDLKTALEHKTYLRNPWKQFTITPMYYGLQGTFVKVNLLLLKGYLWEMTNTSNFIAVHAEKHQVEGLLARGEWLTKMNEGDEFWPQADEWVELWLVDVARLVPYLWD